MKKLSLAILICSILVSCTQRNLIDHFILKGHVDGLKEGWLYLYYSDNKGNRVKDSSSIDKGGFSFQGKINEPANAYLQLKEAKRNEMNSASFFLEPSNITANLQLNNFSNGIFRGSSAQDELEELNKSKASVMAERKPLEAAYEEASGKYREAMKAKKDEATLADLKEKADELHAKFDPFSERLTDLDRKFFNAHPSSPVTAYMLIYHVNDFPLDTLQRFYDHLGLKLQQSANGQELDKQIKQLRNGSPGNPAANFSTVDINGDSLKLSDFKGKYVLLDFWASWCGPCRKGNPHLKELYAKLKVQGIEFIGISDDDSKPDAWRKAVEKDGLPWRHVLRGFDMAKRLKNLPNDNDISDKFGIHSLPTKILIDPSGMIIGRYSEEPGPLDQKLMEVFGSAKSPGLKIGDSHN